VGVVDGVLAASVHLGCARVFDTDLRGVGELAFAGVGCPWEFQCSLPQWRTEQILAERLGELGGVVERGTAHHLLLFGAPDDAGVERLRRRWPGLVDVVQAAGAPPPVGLGSPGALLVRPDGHIGLRVTPADAAGLAALDAHLDSYLVPART
jgi:hypothetical protein